MTKITNTQGGLWRLFGDDSVFDVYLYGYYVSQKYYGRIRFNETITPYTFTDKGYLYNKVTIKPEFNDLESLYYSDDELFREDKPIEISGNKIVVDLYKPYSSQRDYITEQDVENFSADYISGLTVREIADKYKVTFESVRNHLKDKEFYVHSPNKHINDALKKEVREKYLGKKVNYTELARIYGVSDSTIGRWLRE